MGYVAAKEPVEVTRAEAQQALKDGVGVSHTVLSETNSPKATRQTAKRTTAAVERTREAFYLYDLATGKPVKLKKA